MSILANSTVRFTLTEYPRPVGYWILYPGMHPRTMFAVYSRPTDEQIKATTELLGWGWEEVKK